MTGKIQCFNFFQKNLFFACVPLLLSTLCPIFRPVDFNVPDLWCILIERLCGTKNYPYLPHGRDFFLDPLPLWKFQSSFIHLLKFLGLWETSPTPQEFPIPSVGGVWIFPGTTHYAIGWQGEEDGKTLVCDKRDRPINNCRFVVIFT